MARHKSFSYNVRAVAQGRFIYLLVFMLLLMLLFPFLEQSAYGPPVMQLLYSFLLISALYAAAASRWGFRVGIVLFDGAGRATRGPICPIESLAGRTIISK